MIDAQRWPAAGPLVGLRRPDLWLRNRPRVPATPERDIAAQLRPWGVTPDGPALRIGSGRSLTLIVECVEGPMLVKRSKAGLEDASIASEHAVLEELRRQGAQAVRLRRTTTGETLVHDGTDRVAVFDALNGYVPMHELLLAPGARRRAAGAAGTALARLHEALRTFTPPTTPSTGLDPVGGRARPSSWHVERLEAPTADATFRAAAGRLRELDPMLAALNLRATVIHGDFGPYNLLVRRGQPMVLADFELARRDWRLVDVATAVPRFSVSRLGFGRSRALAFLAGYREVDPAIAEELP
ncbi:MAG TPA: phosphotransferase, partial [Candidatus Limnocylindria bacterium]